MEAFKLVKPAELAANLCGDLIASVTARDGGELALALADTLDPGMRRNKAFQQLAASLNPTEFGAVLEKAKASSFPEDVLQLETALVNRAGGFPFAALGDLISRDLSSHAGNRVVPSRMRRSRTWSGF